MSGVSATQQSQLWSKGGKQRVQRDPLAIAASHGQYLRSTCSTGGTVKLRIPNPKLQRTLKFQAESSRLWNLGKELLGATASTALLAVAPVPRLNSILQIARVGSVHTKGRPLDVLHRPDVYFVGEHVTLRYESSEVVDKFGMFHFADVVDEKLAISRRSGESQCLQQRNLAASQINLAVHVEPLANEQREFGAAIAPRVDARRSRANSKRSRAACRFRP